MDLTNLELFKKRSYGRYIALANGQLAIRICGELR